MAPDDLETTLREFRADFAARLEALQRRMEALRGELLREIERAETSIVNALRDVGAHFEPN